MNADENLDASRLKVLNTVRLEQAMLGAKLLPVWDYKSSKEEVLMLTNQGLIGLQTMNKIEV